MTEHYVLTLKYHGGRPDEIIPCNDLGDAKFIYYCARTCEADFAGGSISYPIPTERK